MAKKKDVLQEKKEALQTELQGMISELDLEGLLFLVKQAKVLIHNQNVDRLNAEAAELREETEKAMAKVVEGSTKPPAKKGTLTRDLRIEQSKNGKTFYLFVDGEKHFLDDKEMGSLVTLCYRPKTKTVSIRYLAEYFENERQEILIDHNVRSPDDPFYGLLYDVVKKSFMPGA